MLNMLLETTTRIGSPLLGVIIPLIIFGFSVFITLLLIRHFSRKMEKDSTQDSNE